MKQVHTKRSKCDIWTNHLVAAGGLRGSLEHFRAFPIDAEHNKETAKSKISTPVLALGGDIYPALGGDYPGNFAYSSLQSLASNITGPFLFQDIGFRRNNQNL